ncbi:MAG: rhomboid family intramembrane serine protease [Deltaproteobacteria bacterium]|nr:rhomboid family intramembrane serine protease [Deltaproteobacteria bacterium]
MIPIRDINPRVRFPLVNYALLTACIVVFFFQLALGEQVEALVETYGFVPRDLSRLLAGDAKIEPELLATSLFTSMFLHGGWFHVIGNLLYLRVFGDNVEDRFGHLGFLLFYVASGLAAALGQYLIDPQSTVPMIGASGAIAGVLGAYIVMFPRARILTLFPVFIFLTFIEVPAFFFLGIWALQQFLNGYLSIAVSAQTGSGVGGIAWFAHIGGFVAGLIAGSLARALTPRARRRLRAAG